MAEYNIPSLDHNEILKIVDDVYATGGTMEAVEELCKRAGYTVIDKLCFIDLQYLHDDIKCKSLVQYE